MKYSKYFKGVLHNDGLPQLNAKQWARMMNIAVLEYGIIRLEKVKEMNQNSPEPYTYDLIILNKEGSDLGPPLIWRKNLSKLTFKF